MKIVACVIAKGNEKTLPQCIKSIKKSGCDLLNITLNGEDCSEELVRDSCVKAKLSLNLSWFNWIDDFAACRNYNLKQIPTGYDWFIWVDSDDIIKGNIRKEIESLKPEVDVVWLPYLYAFDEFKNPTNIFYRERIIKTGLLDVKWYGIIHETLTNIQNHKGIKLDSIIIEHHHGEGGTRSGRNFPLIEKMIKENPEDIRSFIFMGHQNLAEDKYAEAIKWYEKFISSVDGSIPEKWQALCYASGSYRMLGELEKAEQLAIEAIRLFPDWQDPYVELARINYMKNDVDKTLYWGEQALVKGRGSELLFHNPLELSHGLFTILAAAYSQVGALGKASEFAKKAVKIRPDESTTELSKRINELIIREDVLHGLKALSVNLLGHGETEKLRKVIDIIPWWVSEQVPDDYSALVNGIMKNTQVLNNYKTFYTDHWDGYMKDKKKSLLNMPRFKWTLDRLNGKKLKVLEIGCCCGEFSSLLADSGHIVTAIDSNPKSIEKAKELDKRVNFECIMFENFKSKRHFDVVIAHEVLEHVPDPQRFLDKMLKLGDKVIISTPLPIRGNTKEERDNPATHGIVEHRRVFTPSDLELMMMKKPGRYLENMLIVPCLADVNNIVTEIGHRNNINKFYKFFIGQGFEQWNPHTALMVGTGGSEFAAMFLTEELANKNNLVFMYINDSGAYNGVIYRPFKSFSPNNPCNVLVSSRIPQVFNEQVQADIKLLWAHDIHLGSAFTPEIAEKINGILVLSKWQANYFKKCYECLKDAEVVDMVGNKADFVDDGAPHPTFEGKCSKPPKLFIIGNGIKELDYDQTRKVKGNFIWTSSPNRGLLEILMMWKDIKKIIPEATLDIYYGWNFFDIGGGNRYYPELKSRIKSLLDQPGVNWKGRVGFYELKKAWEKAEYWLYPPGNEVSRNITHSDNFPETFCITALEAQASRTLMIYRRNGALGETASDRGLAIPLHYNKDDILQMIHMALVMNKKELLDRGQEWVKNHTWTNVAERLEKVIDCLEHS